MRSGFFNSTITGYDEEGRPIFDRAEDASFFAKYFSQLAGNGVFALPADGLMVQAKEGMAVTVKAGTCFINGYMGWLEQDKALQIEACSETFARIDRVVARYDAVQRSIDLYVSKGTPAASPAPPDITQQAQGDIYELALADILVNRNASALRQADITDLRLNEAVCGVVASPVTHLETGAANAQLTDAFNQWFEGIKGQLSEDAAGNLQNQIDAHTGDAAIHAMTGSIQLWAGRTQPAGWLLCNGQAVSRTTYANLFSVLGTAYGQGDGSTTFNVPDVTGRVPVGADNTYPLAGKGGAADGQFTLSEEAYAKIAITGGIEPGIFGAFYVSKPEPETEARFFHGGELESPSGTFQYGTPLGGHTDAGSLMQPYIAQHYIIKY